MTVAPRERLAPHLPAGDSLLSSPQPSPSGSGLAQAFTAYLIWGLLPLYLKLLHRVPPLEFVGWRVVFTLPICLALVLAGRQGPELLAVLRNPRVLGALALSALLIGINWTTYVVAVHNGHVLAASIGYYLNPLLNVVLGTAFLGERLSRSRWLAVTVAVVGVGVLAVEALDALWISLVLAGSFGLYGLVRKLVPVSAITGLTCETIVLILPAGALLGWYAGQPAGLSLGVGPVGDTLLMLSGPLTAIPLMLFAAAARRMDYATLGFIQFLTPTMAFIQGLWLFHEPLNLIQACSFALIWIACAIYCRDLLRRAPAPRA